MDQHTPTLFLKPTADTAATLYSRHIPELDAELSFRSLNLQTDLQLIHGWVNQAYTQRFWQLSGAHTTIENIYTAILKNPNAHSFIGSIGDKPVCQIDVYAVQADELADSIEEVTPGDAGLHLLMCPPREMQKGWSFYALRVFQEFFFSYEQAMRLFAEPDQENILANKLAMDAKFRFVKTVRLSYKTANLYCMRRDEFRPV